MTAQGAAPRRAGTQSPEPSGAAGLIELLLCDPGWTRDTLALPTLAQAVEHTFASVGLPSRTRAYLTVDRLGRPEAHAVVVVDLTHSDARGQGLFMPGEEDPLVDMGVGVLSPEEIARWPRTGGRPYRRTLGGPLQVEQAHDLMAITQTILLDQRRMQAVLARPLAQTQAPRRTAEQAAALDLWWAARMQEGHTTESACLLLGLILPPEVGAQLAFSPDGTPTLAG